ncbi:unnamed protein product [Boreogadus saida]
MLEPDRLQPGRVPCNQQLPRGERRLDLNARVSQTVVRETATTTSSAECSPRRAGSPTPLEERVKWVPSLSGFGLKLTSGRNTRSHVTIPPPPSRWHLPSSRP